ncbi:MAG: hypothetical protein KKC71_06890 [Chloroflexi bacterium]|nr:hypothetical protein [Chloroflexota bacterium]
MLATKFQQITIAWPSLSGVLHVPHTKKEYEETVIFLDGLIDRVGEDESHPLASLMEVLGVLIEKYEDDHIPEIAEI